MVKMNIANNKISDLFKFSVFEKISGIHEKSCLEEN